MEKVIDSFKTIRAAFLIAGTTIGAGMLGIPLVTAGFGFFPAFLITICVWGFMLLTGLLLLEAALHLPEGGNFLSLSKRYLGSSGQVVTGILFIFLYYFLMIAYFAVGSSLLGSLFFKNLPHGMTIFLFGLFFFLIVARGPYWIDRVNFILTIAMGILWIVLMTTGIKDVSIGQLSEYKFSGLLGATPILFSAFGYHNIIPSLVTHLNKDVKSLRTAVITGTLIPLVVYVLWQMFIIGVIPIEVIEETKNAGLPITSALHSITNMPWISLLGQGFALIAIVTSVLGVSFSLVDFLADGLQMKRIGKSRVFLTCITFFPPCVCAYFNPDIFKIALGIAGGIGEGLINGIIPVALVWSVRYLYKDQSSYTVFGGKPLLYLLLFIAIVVIGTEVQHLRIL